MNYDNVKKGPSRAKLVGWNRAHLEDIKASLDCGLKAVHIGAPSSNIHLKAVVKKDQNWLFGTLPRLVEYCKAQGVFVSVSAEDASRTPPERLLAYARLMRDAGADRIRISDTLGLFNPLDYHKLIKTIVHKIGIDVHIHAHNDLGLGMGNVIAGVQAGAKYVHTTVNGWGERVRLPSLEVVVVALKSILGIDNGVNPLLLNNLSSLVAQVFRREVPFWQPVVGKDIFVHESGIHASGTISDQTAFETFPSTWVGKKHQIVAGKHSGSRGIQYIIRQAGLNILRDESLKLLPMVRERAIDLKRTLSVEELLELYLESKSQ